MVELKIGSLVVFLGYMAQANNYYCQYQTIAIKILMLDPFDPDFTLNCSDDPQSKIRSPPHAQPTAGLALAQQQPNRQPSQTPAQHCKPPCGKPPVKPNKQNKCSSLTSTNPNFQSNPTMHSKKRPSLAYEQQLLHKFNTACLKSTKMPLPAPPRPHPTDAQLPKLSESVHALTTIGMLKKQVQLLDCEEEGEGLVHRLYSMSTKSGDQNKCVELNQMGRSEQLAKPRSIVLSVVNKSRRYNNRKIAKGRPELYNWIRSCKKAKEQYEIASNCHIMRKFSSHVNSKDSREDKENEGRKKEGWQKKSMQFGHKETKKLTFIERLNILQDLKKVDEARPNIEEIRARLRTQSQQATAYESRALKTLM